MASFTPKSYLQATLDVIRKFFANCHKSALASEAFSKTTQEEFGKNWGYRALPGFDENMPWFCIRIPTGGGKTWTAAKAVKIINKYLSPRENGLILWLTTGNPICNQTMAGFKNPEHPLHAALSEAGSVTVLSLDEAKSLTRSTLETSTVIIVATHQAFQVEKEKIRHVYKSSGELMQHFENLSPEVEASLLPEMDDNDHVIMPRTVPCSLVNVLRMRRPFIVVDEAHNNRTELAFDTLAKFLPSGIMELTATPDEKKCPSNVLYSVSAAELKNENMIKLPIILTTVSDVSQCLANAIAKRDELQGIADNYRAFGQDRMRPLVLIQAEPRRASKETLHSVAIKEELIKNHHIPEQEICIATGDEKGLEAIERQYEKGINDPACPVKYIITQQALAEGWDCPWAYILVSVAQTDSSTAVEQLLGRILRQPNATRHQDNALNQSYAYVVSDNFTAIANNLRDQLVKVEGFEKKEASQFILPPDEWQHTLMPKVIKVANSDDIGAIPAHLSEKIKWQPDAGKLTIQTRLNGQELEEIQKVITNETIVKEIVSYSTGLEAQSIPEKSLSPSQRGEKIKIPQLSLLVEHNGETVREPFIDASAQLLPPPVILPKDAEPATAEISLLANEQGSSAKIDIDERGKLKSEFLANVQLTLDFTYKPENWNEIQLAAWLCENVETPWLIHEQKFAFVQNWLQKLLENVPLILAVRKKATIRNLIETKLDAIKSLSDEQAGQRLLLSPEAGKIIKVDDLFTFEFSANDYFPASRYNPAKWGYHNFQKHYYPVIGDFDSKEEFECAQFLDKQAQAGKIKFWLRNLVKTPNSFSLKKIDGRFYPDFVCVLPDDTILVVEYKGANMWDTPKVKADRQIGELWASLSNGRCKFVMVKNREWSKIDAAINGK